MRLNYIDQSANNLHLNLINNNFDVNELNILSTSKFFIPYFKFEVGIIGASHYFMFEIAGKRFYEIFACLFLNSENLVFINSVTEIFNGIKLNFFDNVEYSFSTELVSWNEGYKKATLLEQDALGTCHCKRIGLVYEFPRLNGGEVPKTVFFAQYIEQNVVVKTLHSYPNESKMVFTESQITLNR